MLHVVIRESRVISWRAVQFAALAISALFAFPTFADDAALPLKSRDFH